MPGFAELAKERLLEQECNAELPDQRTSINITPLTGPQVVTPPGFGHPAPIPASPGYAPKASQLPQGPLVLQQRRGVESGPPLLSPQGSPPASAFGSPVSPHTRRTSHSVRRRGSAFSMGSAQQTLVLANPSELATAFPGLTQQHRLSLKSPNMQVMEAAAPNTPIQSASPPHAVALRLQHQEREHALRCAANFERLYEDLAVRCADKEVQLKVADDSIWLLRQQLEENNRALSQMGCRNSQFYQHALSTAGMLELIEDENRLLATLLLRLCDAASTVFAAVKQARALLVAPGCSPQRVAELLGEAGDRVGLKEFEEVAAVVQAGREPAPAHPVAPDAPETELAAAALRRASAASATAEGHGHAGGGGDQVPADASTRGIVKVLAAHPVAAARREALRQLRRDDETRPAAAAQGQSTRPPPGPAAGRRTASIVASAALRLMRVRVQRADRTQEVANYLTHIRYRQRRRLLLRTQGLERQLMGNEDSMTVRGPAQGSAQGEADAVERLRNTAPLEPQQQQEVERLVAISAFRDVIKLFTEDAMQSVRRLSRSAYHSLRRAADALSGPHAARIGVAPALASVEGVAGALRSYMEDFGERLFYFCGNFNAKEAAVKEQWMRSMARNRVSIAVQADLAADRYLLELRDLRGSVDLVYASALGDAHRMERLRKERDGLAKTALRLLNCARSALPASELHKLAADRPLSLAAVRRRGGLRRLRLALRRMAWILRRKPAEAEANGEEDGESCGAESCDSEVKELWPPGSDCPSDQPDSPDRWADSDHEEDVQPDLEAPPRQTETLIELARLVERLDLVVPQQKSAGGISVKALFAAKKFTRSIATKRRQKQMERSMSMSMSCLETAEVRTEAPDENPQQKVKSMWANAMLKVGVRQGGTAALIAAIRAQRAKLHESPGEQDSPAPSDLVPPSRAPSLRLAESGHGPRQSISRNASARVSISPQSQSPPTQPQRAASRGSLSGTGRTGSRARFNTSGIGTRPEFTPPRRSSVRVAFDD